MGETVTKAALRVLKHHLENAMGFELSDEQFIAIFYNVINLGPARPLGAWSFQYGFVVPMLKTLQEQDLHCGVKEIFDFFNVRNYDNRRYHNMRQGCLYVCSVLFTNYLDLNLMTMWLSWI